MDQSAAVATTTTTTNKNNQFLNKCFDRIYGLLAIIVADEEGTILLKGLSPHFSALNKVPQVTDFDNAFPATFLLASEQANKLPYGHTDYMISFYENYLVVQLDTHESKSSNNNNNSGNHNNTNHQDDEEDDDGEKGDEQQGTLTITLIANQETSVQLLLSVVPTLKQIFHNL